MAVIDSLAPSKNKPIKGISQDCFDAKIMEKNKWEGLAILEILKILLTYW